MESLIFRRRISAGLIEEISSVVSRGESALLLGPRYCGKRYVSDAVADSLEKIGFLSVKLQFDSPSSDSESSHVPYKVVASPNSLNAKLSVKELFSALGTLHRESDRPVVLFLFGLDGLPQDSARRFLQEIRAATNSPGAWLASIITSESNILELVLGPKSEFTCARVYVLQAYSDEIFDERFGQYAERLSVAFDHAENARSVLRASCGGSTYLLRQFFLACSERRLAKGNVDARGQAFSAREVDEVADALATPGVSECPLFRIAATLIEPDLESLAVLDELFTHAGSLMAKPGYPSRLELAGAVFNTEPKLTFSSPLMEAFLRREFSLARMADLHALAGNWELAFERYRHPSRSLLEKGLRGYQVRAAVLRKLREAFEQSPRERVEELFSECLNSVFGVTTASDVRRIGFRSAGGSAISSADHAELDQHGGRRFVNACVGGGQEVIVKVPPGLPAWLVAELDLVVKAYARAVSRLDADEERAFVASFHHSLTSIARDILRQVFQERLSPSEAADVVICRLRGGLSLIRDARVWLVSQRLHESTITCHPAMITDLGSRQIDERVMKILHEGDLDLSDEEWLRVFGEGPGATHLFLPLESGQVIVGAFGLMLEETPYLPAAAYSEIREFASQVAGILSSAFASARAWKALLRIAEPILVLDSVFRVEFSNDPAGPLLTGFDRSGAPPLDFRQGIEVAAVKKHRYVNFPARLGDRPYEGAVVYEPLLDHGSLLGILIHVRQKSYYADILQAIRALQRAGTKEGALHELVEVFRTLGHKWIRIYRIENDRLVPDYSIDPERPTIAAGFHRTQLPLRDSSATWLAVSTGRPHVFSYQPDRQEGEVYVTAHGLPVYAQRVPPEADLLGKRPDDYWIDFPLKEGESCFGKLTIPCSYDLTPERFQMFEVLSSVVSETLQSMRARPTNIEELEKLRSDLYNSLSHLEVLGELFERCMGEERFGTQDAKALRLAFQSAIRQRRVMVERSNAPEGLP